VAKIIDAILDCLSTDKLQIPVQRHILHSVDFYVMTACVYREYGGTIFIRVGPVAQSV